MSDRSMHGKRLPILLALWLCAPLLTSAETVDRSTPSVVASTSDAWRKMEGPRLPEHEKLSFVLKWGVIVGGCSSLNIEGIEDVQGRPAYHIVSEARSSSVVSAFYKVQDRNEAWLDVDSASSVRFEKKINEGKYRIEESTLIDQVQHRFHLKSYRIDKNLYEQKEGTVPVHVLDVMGSLYYVRLLPLEVGQTYVMDVLSGDKVYPLELKVKARERIRVPAGKFETILVEPLLRGPGIFVAKGKKLEVWMTADVPHVPVRMRTEVFIGHVSAELLPSKP